MSAPTHESDNPRRGLIRPAPRKAAKALIAIAAWVVLSFGVYMSNGRTGGTADTIPATLIPVAVLVHHTVFLDAFAEEANRRHQRVYWLVQTSQGRASIFPLATSVLALPIFAPAVLFQDWRQSLTVGDWYEFATGPLQKVTAAILAALSVGVFWSICAALGFRSELSIALTLLYAFGSQTFALSSQGLWQHGPGSLALLAAMRAHLALDRRPEWAALLLGLFLGLAVAIRSSNLLLAGPIGLAALHAHPRLWLRLILPALFVLAPFAAYNSIVFQHIFGGTKSELTYMALANIPSALPGALFSPARGLFVYFPAALLALILVAWRAKSLLRRPIYAALAGGVLLKVALIAVYYRWYGGWCFGPRLLTETQGPILILLGAALHVQGRRLGVGAAYLGLVLLYSVFIQVMGTFNEATMAWDEIPVDVDSQHSRLWDWSDNPIFRGLRAHFG